MLTPSQKELARHALGFPNSKRKSYRNRFVCQENHPDWQDMVAKGMATMRRGETLPFGGDACFYMTRQGAEAALEPREKLCQEDFPIIRTAPILFSAPMIRAMHDGRKTQTRRILKHQPAVADHKFQGFTGVAETKAVFAGGYGSQTETIPITYKVGDRLWVREAWRCNSWAEDVATIFYKAHESCSYTEMYEQFPVADRKYIRPSQSWKPSIHMPRWISRLTLTVTDIRIVRLQDMSEEDAIAEGVTRIRDGCHVIRGFDYDNAGLCHTHATTPFAKLWDNLNADRGFDWHSNPWVIALTFSVQHGNIDEVIP